jgi:hypothetical protein
LLVAVELLVVSVVVVELVVIERVQVLLVVVQVPRIQSLLKLASLTQSQ